jgi:hypothetical protein
MSSNGARLADGIVPADGFLDPRDADSYEPDLSTAACACGWFSIGTEGAVESAWDDHRLDACAASLLPRGQGVDEDRPQSTT